MRRLPLLILISLFVILWLSFKFSGCWFCFGGVSGKGPVKTETRDLAPFRELSIGISGKVEVVPGENYRVEISAHENLLPIFETKIEDDALEIGFSENVRNSGELKVTVFVPSLESVSLSGSAEVDVKTPVSGEKMAFSLGGSGNIRANQVNGGKLDCGVSGSGKITAFGQVDEMETSISGSGHVEAQELLANEAEISISGSGTVSCNVKDRLDASVSGSGNIRYKGEPNVKSSISGSGSVSRL